MADALNRRISEIQGQKGLSDGRYETFKENMLRDMALIK
jgi:hypothetical protein